MSLKQKMAARVAAVSAAALPVAVFATPADPFTTVMADATTRVNTYAAALVTIGGVAVLFMIALKYIKKIPRAS
jgi:choline-glycine betaine transporter